eukprot:746901-Hanusia_phi.AAC.7
MSSCQTMERYLGFRSWWRSLGNRGWYTSGGTDQEPQVLGEGKRDEGGWGRSAWGLGVVRGIARGSARAYVPSGRVG